MSASDPLSPRACLSVFICLSLSFPVCVCLCQSPLYHPPPPPPPPPHPHPPPPPSPSLSCSSFIAHSFRLNTSTSVRQFNLQSWQSCWVWVVARLRAGSLLLRWRWNQGRSTWSNRRPTGCHCRSCLCTRSTCPPRQNDRTGHRRSWNKIR